MKLIERWLVKIIIVQAVMLLVAQLLFHKWNILPELQQITQYEGVANTSFAELLETFSKK
nr:YpfB family protein [uncultured Bacillus sp.]